MKRLGCVAMIAWASVSVFSVTDLSYGGEEIIKELPQIELPQLVIICSEEDTD